jgi:hypothetical protein
MLVCGLLLPTCDLSEVGNVRWVFLLPMFDLSEVISEPI